MDKEQARNLTESLWEAYTHDRDPQWLISMVSANCFEHAPMPNEISQEIAAEFGKSGYKNADRDQAICRFYGALHADFEKQFSLKHTRQVLSYFPDLKYETVRNVLRSKFVAKKHILKGTDFSFTTHHNFKCNSLS